MRMLNDIIKDFKYIKAVNLGNTEITGITNNSAEIAPGNIFVAVKGFVTDGHKYISSAIEKGAALVVCEVLPDEVIDDVAYLVVDNSRQAMAVLAASYYDYPSEKMKMIGITGTNGKTTMTYMLHSILTDAGVKSGIIGTTGYYIGSRHYPLERTTPESFLLQEILAKMVGEGVQAVAMEVSSHSLDLFRVDEIYFDYVVFTNLSPEHLDYHETMDAYYKAKKKLFAEAFNNNRKIAKGFINIDDEWGKKLHKEFPEAKSFSLKEVSHIRGENVQLKSDHSCFDYSNGISRKIMLNIPGEFNIYNMLPVIAIARELGLSHEQIEKGAANLHAIPGRFETVKSPGGVIYIVDYAHTPDALEKAIAAINQVKGSGRLYTVFGCGGERDREKRPHMGTIASVGSDYTIITNDNPRNEDPEAILNEIKNGIAEDNFKIIPGREEAIKYASSMAEPGDFVLIAGKGHENYQIIGNNKNYFSDTEVVQKLIKEERQER